MYKVIISTGGNVTKMGAINQALVVGMATFIM